MVAKNALGADEDQQDPLYSKLQSKNRNQTHGQNRSTGLTACLSINVYQESYINNVVPVIIY